MFLCCVIPFYKDKSFSLKGFFMKRYAIGLSGLTIQCIIGCFDEERAREQTLKIDLRVTVEETRGLAEDHISATVNYAELALMVTDIVRRGEFRLLETCAKEICGDILRKFGQVRQVFVKVMKPGAIASCDYPFVEFEVQSSD